ncbi:MAG: AAA family ATPase [Planctomycetota bacterium]
MRLLSLRIAHFRGVDERALTFRAQGVTVIEGANETGKSSLAEALDLLLDELDSTKKKKVLDVQPVDRDAGPEVEAEIESGPYRFTYRKRFLRKPETVLRVTAPRAENLTGRAAHERVRRILEETMDLDLWRALRVRQGVGLEANALDRAPSLLRALDAAAGQETAGDRELDLFERVHQEYLRYYTDTGKERAPLKEAAAALTHAREECERVRLELDALERDIERSEQLETRVTALRGEREAGETRLREHEGELARLEKTQEQVAAMRMQATAADASVTAARREQQLRDDRREAAEAAAQRLARLEREAARDRPALAEAEREAAQADALLAESDAGATAAEARYDRAGLDFKFRHYELDLKKMRARRDAVRADRERRQTARDFLAGTKLDADKHAALRRAHLELERLRARHEAQGARLRAEALDDVTLRMDGTGLPFAKGETIDEAVDGERTLELPGILRVTFRGGAGAAELGDAVERQAQQFTALLREAGVASLDEADTVLQQRAAAELTIETCDQQIRQNLDDLTYEDLVGRIEGLETYVENYLAERGDELPVPADYDSAKRANSEAREARESAVAALATARGRQTTAQERLATLRGRLNEAAVELKVAVRDREECERVLAMERERRPDGQVAQELAQAHTKASETRHRFEEAQRTLAERRPDSVRELALNARKVADRAARELRETENERHALLGRLEVRGSEGLFDREQDAQTRRTRAERQLASVEARAGAARRLYETMHAQREEARRAYAAPLREKIEELGRYVFEADFEVELDPELRVARRTLHGRTLPIESLSGGAREQIALITQLAAALLVDPADGVPVILDDALGYTDPGRLEGLGALLSHAGRDAQILVLTCSPGRFRHVGEAEVIRL